MIHKHYDAVIVNNETGEARTYRMNVDWDDSNDSGHIYWWTEGNFGCDCNRALEFMRAGDEEECDESCGESRFSVPHVVLPDGRIIPIDTDPCYGRDAE